MNKKKLDFWKYVTYKMLSLNSSFVFPLEYFFDVLNNIDTFEIDKLLKIQDKGLYIHIPFCVKICDYCGCYKLKISKNDDLDKYVDYLIKELAIFYNIGGQKKLYFSTFMFGGGTASILTSKQLSTLFEGIYKYIDYKSIKQVSFEASPFTLTNEKIDVLKKYGVHRISIGVQSFNKKVMEKNNRIYVTYKKLKELIDYIQDSKILVQIDLMVGIKGQNEENCIEDYKKMLDLGVDSYTMNYYIPHGFANFSDTKSSLLLKEKMKKLDKKMNNITKDMGAYLLQEEYVFNNFNYSVIGLGLGATSNIGNKIIYRKKNFDNYYNSIDSGIIPLDDGIVMNDNFVYIKYIFERYKDGEIDLLDFEKTFGRNFLDLFEKQIDILLLNNVIILEKDKIKFLRNRFENRIYLNIFIEDLIESKGEIEIPILDKQFNFNLMGLIYE